METMRIIYDKSRPLRKDLDTHLTYSLGEVMKQCGINDKNNAGGNNNVRRSIPKNTAKSSNQQ